MCNNVSDSRREYTSAWLSAKTSSNGDSWCSQGIIARSHHRFDPRLTVMLSPVSSCVKLCMNTLMIIKLLRFNVRIYVMHSQSNKVFFNVDAMYHHLPLVDLAMEASGQLHVCVRNIMSCRFNMQK